MGYKIITMKRQLLLYLIKLFVGIVIIIICWLALTNIFVECGVIIPANYSETILEENRKRLDDIQQITDNDLPYGSKYSIFDLDYNYERGTMNKSDIEVTKKILLGKESNLQGNYVYSVIARTEEYCVIKYNIKARFNSDNKIFNYIDYDNLSYITMVLVFLLYVYIMTLHLVGIWKNNFEKIEKITLEIEKQNLDFTYEESKIKEFSNLGNQYIGNFKKGYRQCANPSCGKRVKMTAPNRIYCSKCAEEIDREKAKDRMKKLRNHKMFEADSMKNA